MSEVNQTLDEMLRARFEQLEVEVVGHRNLEDGSEANVCEIRNECGDMIAGFVDEDDANYIVRACNSHDALLAACEEMLTTLTASSRQLSAVTRMEMSPWIPMIQEALQQAKATT